MHLARPRGFAGARSALVVLLLALLLGLSPSARAERLKSQYGFYVDLPAGFVLSDGDKKSRFSFADPNGVMEFDLLAYDPGRFKDLDELSTATIDKLLSHGDVTTFKYEGRKASLAGLEFSLNGTPRKGYGIFVEGRAGDPSFALLAFAPRERFEAYADFILSCLDAFSIDRAALRSPGPVSQFTLDWPPERLSAKTVSLPGGGSASLPWSDDEAAQESDTVKREYKVLVAYEKDAENWMDAWARFYRMVYRESAARLDRLALEASRGLPSNDPTEAARHVLAWVQGFTYERDREGTDFVPPLAAAYGARGDCDSRAVVAAIVLDRMGVDSILMVSREYSHAMLGVDVPGGGQRFAFGGKRYLVGETTAKVGLGMIAAGMEDWSKWLGIDLGN
jgi:hypothetical protein